MTEQRPRRVGVMGGTFDPIHHGHLVAASEVQAWFDLDEVIFVPTGEPWQKSDRRGLRCRGPLPDDGDRDSVQPALLGVPRRHRPRRTDIHDRHPARPSRVAGRRPSSSSSPVPTRSPRSSPGTTPSRSSSSPSSSAAPGPAPPSTPPRCKDSRRTASPCWRSRRWPSRRPSAARGRTRASRSGTSFPTASCSTSPSARSTAPPPIRRAHSASPAQDPATPPWHPNSRTNPTTKEPRDRH